MIFFHLTRQSFEQLLKIQILAQQGARGPLDHVLLPGRVAPLALLGVLKLGLGREVGVEVRSQFSLRIVDDGDELVLNELEIELLGVFDLSLHLVDLF